MQSYKVLIIGVGGTGKSYLATYLRARGIAAFDADSVPNLAQFVTHDAHPVAFLRGADAQWLAQHPFVWVESVLLRLLATTPQLYLFGMADNALDMVMHFDQVYHLRANHELLLRRLTHPERVNWMGETESQRQYVLRQSDALAQQVRQRGIPSIDAALPPDVIYQQIQAVG
jgi:hypothetical protein